MVKLGLKFKNISIYHCNIKLFCNSLKPGSLLLPGQDFLFWTTSRWFNLVILLNGSRYDRIIHSYNNSVKFVSYETILNHRVFTYRY